MTRHAPARAATALSVAFALSLALGPGPAAHAASGASPEAQAAAFKTGLVTAMLAATSRPGSAPALADRPGASTGARRAASVDPSSAGGTTTSPLPSLSAPDATASTCDDLQLDSTPTNDRVWLHWQDVGASQYTVLRMRDGGSWKQVGTTTGTFLLDTRVNPDAVFTYEVLADDLACGLDSWVSMGTDDGWGVPDIAYGSPSSSGNGIVMMQDPSSLAMSTNLGGMDPAYAPDGRRVAVAWQSPELAWYVQVALVGLDGSDPVVSSLAMPAGYLGAEPSWSPDGRSVVYTRYQIDDGTGSVGNPELHVLDALTGVDRAVAGSAGLIQADWRSATQLVSAGFEPGEGLVTIPAAGGTQTPIAGTANAAYPEVAPDGRTWFVEFDGDTASVRAMVPQAGDQVATVRTSTTHLYERPRVSPDGTVFVIDVDRHDLSDPDDDTFTVVAGTFGPDGMEPTAIGLSADGQSDGIFGYDVRQPKSKGTADFVGDAGPDILARDSAGTMWAYPSTPTALAAARLRIGTGWNIYNAFLAAGDLNGDDRADILARDKSGYLWRYDGLGQGQVRPRVKIGSGWGSYLPVATGDFNGDGTADLVARASTGALWLYPGTGRGTLGPRWQIGSGWNVMNAIVGVGDFDLDGRADLVAREASTGKLWLYAGNGQVGFLPRRQVGSGWQVFSGLAGPELIGSSPMVYARRTDGVLVAYRVLGDGRFSGNEVYRVGSGWSTYGFTS